MGYDVYNGLNYINGPVYSVWFPLKLALFFFFCTTKKTPKNKNRNLKLRCLSNGTEVRKFHNGT